MIDRKTETRKPETEPVVSVSECELKRRSRRSFLALAAGAALGVGGWKWLNSRSEEDGVPGPYRRAFDLNRKVTGRALFRDSHRAPEFPQSKVREIRVNGDIGMSGDLNETAWRLQVAPLGSGQASHHLNMAAVRMLPKVEQTIEFKCIEGWSVITNWGGVRLRDFTAQYAPGSEKADYVGLVTPDGDYYTASPNFRDMSLTLTETGAGIREFGLVLAGCSERVG